MGNETRSGRRREHRAEMLAMVEAFEASGRSQGGFCRERGIALGTLQYWRRQVKRERRQAFAEVEIVDGQLSRTSEPGLPARVFELVLRGGVVARLPFEADEDLIRRIVHAGSGRSGPC